MTLLTFFTVYMLFITGMGLISFIQVEVLACVGTSEMSLIILLIEDDLAV
jgi:hypothetical protein